MAKGTVKILNSGAVVPQRCYEYLVDFNKEDNQVTFHRIAPGASKVSELDLETFWTLYQSVIRQEMDQQIACLQIA